MKYELKDVSIGYKGKVVATDMSASLNEGELTCLVGRNGAGKSTLLRTMAAFQPPLSGSITIVPSPVACGTSASNATVPGSSAVGPATVPGSFPAGASLSHLVGIVLTEKPDVQNMTVTDMVAMGRSPYTGFFGRMTANDKEIVREAIRMVGMETFHDRMIQTLSDGERQKVMIAKALAQQTPFILLDEPTAFLDYPSKIDTMKMLQRLCHEQRKAVLISTHDLDVALRYCDNIWHMHDGTLTTDITNATPSMFM